MVIPVQDHEMSEEEYLYEDDSESESEQDPPPEPDSDIEELGPEDFPKYFSERKRRLFHSTDAPYPLPVDGPEQHVRYLSCIFVFI